LKTGAQYVPIDSSLPDDRKRFMAEDTDIRLMISDSPEKLVFLGGSETQKLVLNEQMLRRKRSKPIAHITGDDFAYVMYTSGSTGKPKGSRIKHRNITRLFYGEDEINIESVDEVLQWSNFSFDGSVYEIFGALSQGATLHMIPGQIAADAKELSKIVKNSSITVAFFTTALFNAFVDQGIESLAGMRRILFGGELSSVQLTKTALEVLGPGKIIHVYGTTEATVFSTCYPVNKVEGNYLPIGKPLSNTSIYILDSQQKLTGKGMIGEICIGGEGVCEGYLNRDHLTSEKFVNVSFGDRQIHKVYRTGDMARWNRNGDLEIIGRVDNLVKIRGYRIELGEIENLLGKAGFVRDCCIVCHQNEVGEKYLVAYVVTSGEFDKDQIKTYLLGKLPQYMVPGFIIGLDELPLTNNGKIDRKKLPMPSVVENMTEEYAEPTNDTERKLQDIWKSLIDIENVGIRDDFFEIGGHSLIATKMVKRVKDAFDFEISVADIFNYPSIKELSDLIGATVNHEDGLDELIDLEKESSIKISYSQLGSLPPYAKKPKDILLTGATGFVGVYVLHELIKQTDATIHCLVRSLDQRSGLERIREKLVFFELPYEQLKDRIKIVYGDLSEEKLGFNETVYNELSKKVDYIFHVGTHMDHHSSYQKLKAANVEGNAEMVRFSINHKKKKLIYASTQPQANPSISEKIDESGNRSDENHRYAAGYSGSKWVGERVISNSITQGVDAVIFRLGLITGDPKTAKIPTEQWFPRLLKTCYQMGAYFDEFHMPVIPVDFVAKSMVKLAFAESDQRVFHLTGSQLVSLGEFFRLADDLKDHAIQIPVSEWLNKLNQADVDGLPIASFIDFSADQVKQTMSGEDTLTAVAPYIENPVSVELTMKILKEEHGLDYPDHEEYFHKYLSAIV
ncbi:MAG: amino acid adenylation domain-containing protein, partial [Cyclobacteriaceae bacterium]